MKLAIVGGGPRGLYALECIMLSAYNNQLNSGIEIILFESREFLGSGWVWRPNQLESNWLNINERALKDLPGRIETKYKDTIVPSFPSYTDWLPKAEQNPPLSKADTFPPRSKMGLYLIDRFNTLADVLVGCEILTIVKEQVHNVNYLGNTISLETSEKTYTNFNDIVLTIGHQDTFLDDQLSEWKTYADANSSVTLHTEAYPIEPILNDHLKISTTIAFRGFGLATIDHLRAITEKLGGSFETVNDRTRQVRFNKGPIREQSLVPFSLNGLPMVPKPLNGDIDNNFKPTDDELNDFAETIHSKSHKKPLADNHYFLIEAMAKVASNVFMRLGKLARAHTLSQNDVELLIISYLNNQELEHDLLLDLDMDVLKMMTSQVGMATLQETISLDYCIGQVWRHCQPTFYKTFSYPKLEDDVVAEIIGLDEASKRYSYGPPVESIQQLIALCEAKVLNLEFLNDPNIALESDGWKLSLNGTHIVANKMINSILDAPKLVDVDAPIIRSLLDNAIIEPLHTDLGIRTDDVNYIITPEDTPKAPIAVLGRLSKGSVIGVDAILECFNVRIRNWAEHLVTNMTLKTPVAEE